MGYPVTNIMAIRTGGALASKVDRADMLCRIRSLLDKRDYGIERGRLRHCVSCELHGGKSSYVVLAGGFNYWSYEKSSPLAQALSKEFGTEVLHLCWSEETGKTDVQIWLDGRPICEVHENPIGRTLRRLA